MAFYIGRGNTMTDRQIMCFLEAAREMNFTKAANKLFLPQPAVSRYIAALEKELGCELFIREGSRKITLTQEGKVYFHMFQRFAGEFAQTRALLNTPLHTLHFGYNIGWNISSFLPEVVAACKAKYPGFSIAVQCLGFHDLLEGLVNGSLDAILTIGDYPENHPEVEQEQITSIQRIIIYSERLFPNQNGLTPSDFYACDFFVDDDARIQQLSLQIEEIFKPYHFVPRLKSVANMETVIASVENGLGVALLDVWGQNITNPGLRYVEMDSKHRICLAWKKNHAPAAVKILKDELREALRAADGETKR